MEASNGHLFLDTFVQEVTQMAARMTTKAQQLGLVNADDVKSTFGHRFNENELSAEFSKLLTQKETPRKGSPKSKPSHSAEGTTGDSKPLPSMEDLNSETWFKKTKLPELKEFCTRLGIDLPQGQNNQNKRVLVTLLKNNTGSVSTPVEEAEKIPGAVYDGNTPRTAKRHAQLTKPRTNKKINYIQIKNYSVIDTSAEYSFVLVLDDDKNVIGIFNKEDVANLEEDDTPVIRQLDDEALSLAQSHNLKVVMSDDLE